mmetsp:Transcript_27394/g.66510  ORF Transcript_27394/g.66510 Transcript_27394/m.66510 type:complete len:105 (+) Transcript_27394:1604-1918(+)
MFDTTVCNGRKRYPKDCIIFVAGISIPYGYNCTCFVGCNPLTPTLRRFVYLSKTFSTGPGITEFPYDIFDDTACNNVFSPRSLETRVERHPSISSRLEVRWEVD